MPRPIEFTRPEFKRGYLLARRDNRYYLLARLFAKTHHYSEQKLLDDGFIDWRTKEIIEKRIYPGVILPLELGREYHDQEFLEHGRPQSAKLLAKRDASGELEFYVHVAFEFTPQPVTPETILVVSRGAAKLGSATLIDGNGRVLMNRLELEGAGFAAEVARPLAGDAVDRVPFLRRDAQAGELFGGHFRAPPDGLGFGHRDNIS